MTAVIWYGIATAFVAICMLAFIAARRAELDRRRWAALRILDNFGPELTIRALDMQLFSEREERTLGETQALIEWLQLRGWVRPYAGPGVHVTPAGRRALAEHDRPAVPA